MALIVFLLVLSVLVVIHEAGHFFAAKLFKIKVEEFGFGFPPRAIGFLKEKTGWRRVPRKMNDTYPQTIWSINWLPLGGFVRLKGEQGGTAEDGPDMFHSKPAWQRLIVLLAGVFMNAVLAVALFSIVFTMGTYSSLDELPASATVRERSVRIVQVMPGAPADKAGLKLGDNIVSIGSTVPQTTEEARRLIAAAGDQGAALRVLRDEKTVEVEVKPVFIADIGRPAIGVGLADVGRVSFSPPMAVWMGVRTTVGYVKAILSTFGDLILDVFRSQKVSGDLSGPVGIAVLTGEVAQQGIIPLLQFAAILSVNLCIVNALPIPALDGGRVLFLLFEKIRRKKMARQIEMAIHNVAFLLLLLLVVVVTIHDISRYGGVIMSGVKGLLGI